MPEKEELITEYTQVFKVDRASLEQVLTIARDMEEHAEAMAKSAGAYADHMAETFGVIIEDGDEVKKAMKGVSDETEEGKKKAFGLGDAFTQVLSGLGVKIPALSYATLGVMAVQIDEAVAGFSRWGHEIELVSSISKEWAESHVTDLFNIGNRYGLNLQEVKDTSKEVFAMGFTAETAMAGYERTIERSVLLGISLKESARMVSYEMDVLGKNTDEVADRTAELELTYDKLAATWEVDRAVAKQVYNQIMEMGRGFAELRGAPAIQLQTLLGLEPEQFRKLQMEAPETLVDMVMERFSEVTKGMDPTMRRGALEMMFQQYGVTDPRVLDEMVKMTMAEGVRPLEPVITTAELDAKMAEQQKDLQSFVGLWEQTKEATQAYTTGKLWVPTAQQFRAGPPPLPPGALVTAPGGVGVSPEILEMWRAMPPEEMGPRGGYFPGYMPEPTEVTVNLVVEEIPEGVMVRTSDGNVLFTQGQGERFKTPGPGVR